MINLRQFISGLLVGFFLATAIIFGIVQVSLGADYAQLKKGEQIAQGAYLITHSTAFADVQAFAAALGTAAESISALPVLGVVANAADVPQYSQAINVLLENSKILSENMLLLIRFNLWMLGISGPAVLISIVMILVGFWLLFSDGKKKLAAEKKATKKRGRK